MSDIDPELFIYVKIQDSLGPLDRGDQYEDPLDAALRQHELGEISGGGSQLGDDRPDGTPSIEFCGLDVEATDRDRALALLRDELRRLGAPPGTELHYTVGGASLQDELSSVGWRIEQPRTFLHPYFQC